MQSHIMKGLQRVIFHLNSKNPFLKGTCSFPGECFPGNEPWQLHFPLKECGKPYKDKLAHTRVAREGFWSLESV